MIVINLKLSLMSYLSLLLMHDCPEVQQYQNFQIKTS